jgi:hypothetical protein
MEVEVNFSYSQQECWIIQDIIIAFLLVIELDWKLAAEIMQMI